jgi:hypothetical protein
MTSPDDNSAPSPPTAGLHRVVFLTAGHKGPQFQLQLQQHIAADRQRTLIESSLALLAQLALLRLEHALGHASTL